MVLVLDDNNDTVRKYTWGLDMSGMQGAAGFSPRGSSTGHDAAGIHGIGGLLSCDETQGTSSTEDDKLYWFFYDANGNVSQVLDATDPGNLTIAARYEYEPYGNVVGPDDNGNGDWRDDAGPYAETNPFRFSTKWLDDELAGENVNGAVGSDGLYYYGYRYYTPRLGRWPNHESVSHTWAGLTTAHERRHVPTAKGAAPRKRPSRHRFAYQTERNPLVSASLLQTEP